MLLFDTALFTGQISVTPEQLVEKSDELRGIVASLRTKFMELNAVVEESKTYWIGEAGDSIRKEYADLNQDLEIFLQAMSDYPVKLEQMAGVYVSHDSSALQKAEALPSDVLD